MAKAVQRQDYVDRFLERLRANVDVRSLDLEVEAIVDRINGLSRLIKGTMEETLKDFGLNHGEFKVLGSLLHVGAPNCMSPGELAEDLHLSSGAMTNRLDRLEERGLVRRLPDPDDRRALRVELTPAGRRLWHEAVAAQAEKEQVVAAALTKKEQRELNELLRRLLLVFEPEEES